MTAVTWRIRAKKCNKIRKKFRGCYKAMHSVFLEHRLHRFSRYANIIQDYPSTNNILDVLSRIIFKKQSMLNYTLLTFVSNRKMLNQVA